jgi:hypothetical protein
MEVAVSVLVALRSIHLFSYFPVFAFLLFLLKGVFSALMLDFNLIIYVYK